MPTFHKLAACAVAIIITPANLPFSSTPKATMMPITIGTRQETRAVVLGTKKLRMNPTTITPAKTLFVLAPIFDSTNRAMRLSKPVSIIPAARNSAPATNARAGFAKPPSAIVKPSLVVYHLVGAETLGGIPSEKAINARITPALAGYEIESVIQTMTENSRIASIRFPATGRSAGVGRKLTTINAMPPITRPYRWKNDAVVPARRLPEMPTAEALAADLDVAMGPPHDSKLLNHGKLASIVIHFKANDRSSAAYQRDGCIVVLDNQIDLCVAGSSVLANRLKQRSRSRGVQDLEWEGSRKGWSEAGQTQRAINR